MKSFLRLSLPILLLGAAILGLSPLRAQPAAEPPASPVFSPAQETAIEALIERYLLDHPDLIVRVIAKLEARDEAAAEAQVAPRIPAIREQIAADPFVLVAGNPDGDVTIIEFFDYQCGYCREGYAALHDLVTADGQIRLLLVNQAFIGRPSIRAALAVQAARAQDGHWRLHDALMTTDVELDEAHLRDLAAAVDLDVEALTAEMDRLEPEVFAYLLKVGRWVKDLRLKGTPTLIIGDERLSGAIDPSQITPALHRARTQ